jgi:hypothetical protein
MRWAGHVTNMGDMRNRCRILVLILKQRDPLIYIAVSRGK